MDRKPLPAPFAKGTILRYIGEGGVYAEAADGSHVPVKVRGVQVTVDEVRPGRQGTLRQLPGEWDDDDPPLDTTTDGYSVYHIPVPGRKPFGRIIWPADAGDWERI